LAKSKAQVEVSVNKGSEYLKKLKFEILLLDHESVRISDYFKLNVSANTHD